MPIQPFKFERSFARYKFSVKPLLNFSDCESLYFNLKEEKQIL